MVGEKIMTAKEITQSIAYCGLVCSMCHLADTCGGAGAKRTAAATTSRNKGATSITVVWDMDMMAVGSAANSPAGKACLPRGMTYG